MGKQKQDGALLCHLSVSLLLRAHQALNTLSYIPSFKHRMKLFRGYTQNSLYMLQSTEEGEI